MYRMVFAQILRRFLIGSVLLTGILVASCTSFRTFPIEVLKPAPISLEKGSRVGYWNRNVCCDPDSIMALCNYEGMTPADLSFLFYTGLNSVWQEIKGDTLSALSGTTTIYMDKDTIPVAVSYPELQKIFAAFGLDYLVTLEQCTYRLDKDLGSVYNHYYIRLYSRFTEHPIDSAIYRGELTYFVPEDNSYEYVGEDAWKIGQEYAYRLLPSWAETERRIYNRQKVLKMGDVLFRENKTEQAVSLWTAATKLSPAIAVQAYINLAWVDENEGNFEGAIRQLETAGKIAKENKLINADVQFLEEYRKILKKRIQEIQQVDEQL